ncbi:unnamed protein product [Discosporangium mesarthrocarpum]
MSSTVLWHKLPFSKFIGHELKRDGCRQFMMGLGVSFVLFGIVPSMGITDEDRKNSVYYQQRMRTMVYSDH